MRNLLVILLLIASNIVCLAQNDKGQNEKIFHIELCLKTPLSNPFSKCTLIKSQLFETKKIDSEYEVQYYMHSKYVLEHSKIVNTINTPNSAYIPNIKKKYSFTLSLNNETFEIEFYNNTTKEIALLVLIKFRSAISGAWFTGSLSLHRDLFRTEILHAKKTAGLLPRGPRYYNLHFILDINLQS